MNFKVNDSNHFLALEHKYVYSNSNYPGYRSPQGGKYSQIECMLREIDRVTAAGETELYQGLFDMQAERHFIVLDARGREIDEIFEPDPNNTRNSDWTAVSYASFASRLRHYFQENHNLGLIPILGQLFAGWH